MGSRSPTGRGTFEGGHVAAHCIVPTHECIAPAAGECACPAHAADECIRLREGMRRRRCGLLPNYFGHLLHKVTEPERQLQSLSVYTQ